MKKEHVLHTRAIKAYLILFSLIICGLAASIVSASKIAHVGVNFPFSNIIFSIFTYPIVDSVCEIWGKKVAQQTVWLALFCQLLIVLLLQISIIFPHAVFWTKQQPYQEVLSASSRVVIASIVAFMTSQLLDIVVYQKIKNAMRGKWLWLRSNVSTILGQFVDSSLFVLIVFYASQNKLSIFSGSMLAKIILSVLMTPIVYIIVFSVNKYLDSKTMAFNSEVA